MYGGAEADLTGCGCVDLVRGCAGPNPPGPLRLPRRPAAGLESAAPRVRLRGEQRVAPHAPRGAVLRAGHAGRATRARTPAAGRGRRVPPPGGPAPRAAPAVQRHPDRALSPSAATRRMDGPGLRPGRAAPQPPLEPRVRGRLRDHRLLA